MSGFIYRDVMWFAVLQYAVFIALNIGLGYLVGRDRGFKNGVRACLRISRGHPVSKRDARRVDAMDEMDLPTF